MNSVRDLFLDFQDYRGGRNSEEGGGGGRWLTRPASHYYVLYPLRKSKSSGFPNQGLSSSALWRHEDFSQRAYTRNTDLLMLGSFNLRSLTRNVGPFPKEGFVVRTLQQKGPTLVAWLSKFK